VLGAHSVDTVVHREFRGKGLFIEGARRCYELAREEGVQFLYGFPGPTTHRGMVRHLEWMNASRLSCLSFAVDVSRLLQARGVWNPAARLMARLSLTAWRDHFGRRLERGADTRTKVGRITEFDGSFDGLWRVCRAHFPLGLWRDREYLQWRYVAIRHEAYAMFRASRDGETVGFVVLKDRSENGVRVGIIVDVLAREPVDRTIRALLRAAMAHFRERGVVTPASRYRSPVKRLGFMSWPGRRMRTIVHTLGEASREQRPTARRGWHMTGGDLEFM
jgi:hypothetical protein